MCYCSKNYVNAKFISSLQISLRFKKRRAQFLTNTQKTGLSKCQNQIYPSSVFYSFHSSKILEKWKILQHRDFFSVQMERKSFINTNEIHFHHKSTLCPFQLSSNCMPFIPMHHNRLLEFRVSFYWFRWSLFTNLLGKKRTLIEQRITDG